MMAELIVAEMGPKIPVEHRVGNMLISIWLQYSFYNIDFFIEHYVPQICEIYSTRSYQ